MAPSTPLGSSKRGPMNIHKICFGINSKVFSISPSMGSMSLSSFLRDKEHLKGTKIVCAEGDCGACAVLIDRSGRGKYEPVNSCIFPMIALEGAHIVTIEGLSEAYPSHPVKEALIESLGSQCGFCTPGFMVTLSNFYERSLTKKCPPQKETIKLGCSGHLCRCTGYQDILSGAIKAFEQKASLNPLHEVFGEVREKIFNQTKKDIFYKDENQLLAIPATMSRALSWKAEYPEIKILGGATDLGVEANKRELFFQSWMSLKNIDELSRLQKKKDGRYEIGANVSLTSVRRALKKDHPEFSEFLKNFASPNIRHVGTLVGNIVTASPIGDVLPYLVLNDAEVTLMSLRGVRHVKINDFFCGYRQTCLGADEIVASITLFPRDMGATIMLQKVSKREHMDISTLSIAVKGQMIDGRLAHFACVFGGMAATVERDSVFEDQWNGLTLEELKAKKVSLAQVYKPLSDHRGSSRYRLTVAENLLRGFFERLTTSSIKAAPKAEEGVL
ncbi:MAG: xanthine dehydrogenase small subunit [Pseudomonadota bacterium]